MRYLTASLLTGIIFLASSAFAEQSLLTFSVMGDTPYSASDARTLQRQLANLNTESVFAVHLGDIKTGIMPCAENWYRHVADILRQSPKRLFIIPGDNEWNDCFDPEEAWTLWTRYFLRFDAQWPSSIHVVRDERHRENFAFVSNGVLCVGLNLVGGTVLDPIAWSVRDRDAIQWIETQWRHKKQPVSHLVIFGHALPDRNHRTFFLMLNRMAHSFEKPILYIHGDGHNWRQEHPFLADNIWRVQVAQGGRANPITVTVTNDPEEPFVFMRE